VLSYRPEHFATTEPFVIAYLVLFTGRRARERRGASLRRGWRGIVDGNARVRHAARLAARAGRLVEGRQLGMALSTAGFGLFYALLATWVWRRAAEALRRIGEAFLALGGRVRHDRDPARDRRRAHTTLVWALEGAGIYWVAARQRAGSRRASGVALQGSRRPRSVRVDVARPFSRARSALHRAREPALPLGRRDRVSRGLFIAREA
jgi:uncharacterized membrane protein